MSRVSINDDVSDRQIELDNESGGGGAGWLENRPPRRGARLVAVEDVVPEYVHKSAHAKAQQKIQELEAEVDDLRRRNRRLLRSNRTLADQPHYVHRTKYNKVLVTVRTQKVAGEVLTRRYREVCKQNLELRERLQQVQEE